MKTVIEMAREAGLVGGPVYARGLERFAELVRADEREACAKVCIWIPRHMGRLWQVQNSNDGARVCRRHPSKGQHMKIAWFFIGVMLALLTIRSCV